MQYYSAFQLVIQSELYFPELLPLAGSSDCKFDVSIKIGKVDRQGIPNPLYHGLLYQVNEVCFWLTVPDVARFLISGGNSIIVEPFAGVDEDSIRVFILGSCMGALLMQRNLFLLHGNAIKVGSNCISFAGNSGVGKSTLSAAFFKRGYSILADDVCAVDSIGHVLPSFPQIKLWLDASTHLKIETEALRKIRPNIDKFAVPLGTQFHSDPLTLKVVYILQSHNKDDFKFSTISGMNKLKPLQNNTYRRAYLKGMGKEKAYFNQCGTLSNQIHLVNIVRPQHGFKLDKLVNLIEADIHARGLIDAC